jgi:hypothetical protein
LIERQSTGPLTIVHGDTHFENFVTARDQSDCRIIDWENWEIAPGTDDLAYTLALLCFAEQRKQSEQALLRHYHRTLLAAGVVGYTWDALWSDYRLSVIKHLCTPIYHWANGVLPPVWWNNLERVLTAHEDLGCAQIMAELNSA